MTHLNIFGLGHWTRALFAATLFAAWAMAEERADLLIHDFEGADYGSWKVSGEAFGNGPAPGTLPNQMHVTGYLGKGLVNSFVGGDNAQGKLTSPPIKVERKHFNFLIGGGGHPRETCVNLLHGGRVVRTASGANTQAGGSEELEPASWDVAEFLGQEVVVEIVDQRQGGWGHINFDHLVQSDQPVAHQTAAARELKVTQPYLLLPVKHGGRKRIMSFVIEGQKVREFEIELAEEKSDFVTAAHLSPWLGKTLKIEVDKLPANSPALNRLEPAASPPGGEELYREKLRPQFHFSAARGWLNDPNGLVYHAGEYHLFFQHNPYGTAWGNMTWGHAVSADLVRWRELPDALHADRLGTMFSGSAVVDHANTTGWKRGDEPALVCIYTAAGGTSAWSRNVPFTQGVAYSTDRGRTWTTYEKNPVLANIHAGNRDPKVFWHAPSKQWVMILYLDVREKFGLFGSTNLREWTKLSDLIIPDGHECPDLFELPLVGRPGESRWIAWEANGKYLVGRFDGKTFTTDSGPHDSKFGAHDYAAQTFSDIPAADGRRIQIAWMQGGPYPGMPFNQQMTIPRELTLRHTTAGPRLCFQPVKEIESLRTKTVPFSMAVAPGGKWAIGPELAGGELLDLEFDLLKTTATSTGVEIRGHFVEYRPREKKLLALGRAAPLAMEGDSLRLRVLVDRTSIEVFAGQGEVQLASCFVPKEGESTVRFFAEGGSASFLNGRVSTLKSSWGEK